MEKILFLVQLPPPIHGASAVNQSIKHSTIINKSFSTKYVNISPAKDLSDIGKLSINKLASFFMIIFNCTVSFLKFKPDLVYVTLSPHGLAFYKDGLISLIIKALGGKLVFHLHGKGIKKESDKSWIKKKLYKLVFRNAHIIHLSDKLFFDVNDVRDFSQSLTAVPNGIDNSIPPSPNQAKPIFTFIYLSNLVRTKGADTLIRATALIDKKYSKSFKVKIIGKSSSANYLLELKQLITPDLEETISLIGPKYGDDKVQELLGSHVFILPTTNDCFPLSILEAMAAGLSIISTTEGAITDIVEHGITGEIISDLNPATLAAAMVKHLENREYSENCSKAAREKYILKYTHETFETNLLSTLKTLIEKR